jgi:GNAT superfamily N-acetyltransferase
MVLEPPARRLDQEITIRDFRPEDYEAVAGVSNTIFAEYAMDAEEYRHEDETVASGGYTNKRFVAEEKGTGQVVGSAQYRHAVGYFNPKRFFVWFEVLPEYQGRGIGSALYERVLEDVGSLEAKAIHTETAEWLPSSVAFLEHRGFAETSREWESRIDPREVDLGQFRSYLDRVEQEGVVITTLAEEKERDPNWLQKVYDLHITIKRDVPSPYEYTPPPLEMFVKGTLEAPESVPDGYFIAKYGDQYIGESLLGVSLAGPSPLHQRMTGVRPEWRGKGIAVAMKIHTIEYAKQHGFDMLKTWNSTLNGPMLAVNMKLGFKRQPAWVEFEKKLDPPQA